jgi:hypothetical protein
MVEYQPPQEWEQWVNWLAAGLHGRNRWRLSPILLGMLFASGRRTVSSWLRAVGIADDFTCYYYFLQPLGRKALDIALRLFVLLLARLPLGDRLVLVVDDSPTKRYGPKVEGAGTHRNPTPGPADQKFLYGHIWVTISLAIRHPSWDTIGLPLLGLLYVRAKDIEKIPARHQWAFRTKLQMAVDALLKFVELAKSVGKRVWVVVDGAFANSPFIRPLRRAGVVVVSRLRKNAHVNTLPPKLKPGQRRGRGQPRIYGKERVHLGRRAAHPSGWETIECVMYGQLVCKTVKTFLATYRPAGGIIRVVIVKEDKGYQYLFCTDPDATPREILEVFSDRSVIEQDFHDVKEVWGAGQQQVRNIWANIAAFNLNLWVHTLVECWAWKKPVAEIRDRSASPWDDSDRRPSHADRRKALRRKILRNEYLLLRTSHRRSSRIRALYSLLLALAT